MAAPVEDAAHRHPRGHPRMPSRAVAVTAVVLAAVLLVLSGCSRGAAPAADPSVPASSATSSKAEPSGGATSRHPAATTTGAVPGSTSAADPSAPTTPEPTPATTPVPPPSKGDIHHTVSARPERVESQVDLSSPAQPTVGVSVRLVQIKSITTKARQLGEVAGPGLAVSVQVRNQTSQAIDLNNSIVDLRGSNDARAIAVSGEPASPFIGSLAPGGTAVGVYAFTIPAAQRDHISIRFSYSGKVPTVLFVGDAQ